MKELFIFPGKAIINVDCVQHIEVIGPYINIYTISPNPVIVINYNTNEEAVTALNFCYERRSI